MVCPNCGTENRPGRKFCSQCGQTLAAVCPVCGASNEPSDRFCGECGTDLETAEHGAAAAIARPVVAQPAAHSLDRGETERRLVTVLFADLVGFTSLSEQRDAEEVRDLLSRYFDTCSRLIGRYGGTVEKFIGDAVMAVWGTPTAQEDDAERAVRAALDLAGAVAALGAELGATDLRARVGVLTGEAAVTLGAQGQGMVAGDLVNTASRIQSVAEPGTVLVGEATRRTTEAAIDYEDAGAHDLKGKADRVPLWRALRVVAGVRGALKASGLEAPFVGRDRELRLIKELFHASAEERKAHLVSVVGIGGIGKSRLTWEFFKYIDGLADNVWWHRGRCLAYGEGVAYWALADMVRMRTRIDEGEEAAAAAAKLRTAVERHIADPEERRWIEPRLAQLLGLEERTTSDRDELFSAWRLFFERLAEEAPTIMVFEDMQWADAALLDFVSYLLDWSRNHAVFVVALARPELSERHPNWAAGKRNFTSLFLEPLPATAMQQLLGGLVPGLPSDLQSQILDRAEGVPLYAVETVRMLIDRGLVVQEGNRYRPAGRVEDLDVPETLHALIAARLDGLTPDERRLLQDASVLGKAFTKEGVVAVSGLAASAADDLLSSLVRKEILSFQTDPRSSERGQYGFLQDLVKRVAYETLSKRERKARHVAVAEYLAGSADEDEVIEIIASHYLDAYRATPEGPDADGLRGKAREALVRAGERAASLAANADAQRYFDQAYELADDDAQRADLSERAGETAYVAGHGEQGRERFERAAALYRSIGMPQAAARVSAKLAELLWLGLNRLDEAVELMESSLAVLAGGATDETVAMLMAQAARLHYFQGHIEVASTWVDRALEAAERLALPELLSQALNTKNLIIRASGREQEAMALLKHALDIAVEHDLPRATSRALNNLADVLQNRDRVEEALEYDRQNLDLAARRGDRPSQVMATVHIVFDYDLLGRWEEALTMASSLGSPEESPDEEVWLTFMKATLVPILVRRGEIEAARRAQERLEGLGETTEVQDQFFRAVITGWVRLGEGRMEDALEAAEAAFGLRDRLGGIPSVVPAFALGLEASLELGRLDRAKELVAIAESAPPRDRTPFIRASMARFKGREAAAEGNVDDADRWTAQAVALFREIKNSFWMAVTETERAEVLLRADRTDDAGPLLTEAREIFEGLKAAPWLERVARAEAGALDRAGVPT